MVDCTELSLNYETYKGAQSRIDGQVRWQWIDVQGRWESIDVWEWKGIDILE